MDVRHHYRFLDLGIRASSVGLVLLAVFALRALRHMVQAPVHPASVAEIMLAAIGFLAATGGMMLLALGAHIFDKVEISRRWRRARDPGQLYGR